MKNPAVFGFYGYSKKGKTSLIIRIIKQLEKQGYKTAVIKMTDKKTTMDIKGKDTYIFTQAGARLAVLKSQNETDIIIKRKQDLDEIIKNIGTLGIYDIILVEGANDRNTQKIRIGDIPERPNTIHHYKGDFNKLFGLIKKQIEQQKQGSKEKLEIKVNDKNIQLNEFTKKFIKNTIYGMLKTLKGVKEIKKLEINYEES
ncbi:MAG: molybdopterin-guanine dinucleotide biosynthesis protein B [Candidatus Thermoplasmatota archaeon]|nr:molybdopterin-guanine dinucleotide biosynthesis protein B [Candidatus Thermoplasmatota archaeon]